MNLGFAWPKIMAIAFFNQAESAFFKPSNKARAVLENGIDAAGQDAPEGFEVADRHVFVP
jgi:hypothetical protein